MELIVSHKKFDDSSFEVVERKGLGHPDTLSDALAEYLSVKYSRFTKDNFGAILHHNFDKVGLLGGSSHVKLGEGYLTKPIRVLLNGRASTSFSGQEIPVEELLEEWTREFFSGKLDNVNVDKDLQFHFNLSNQSSPGKTEEDASKRGTRKFWFEPRGLHDLKELSFLNSNDTSMGVGYAPLSLMEQFVIGVEGRLNSKEFKEVNPWIGSDIKLMGVRKHEEFFLTLCIPQISTEVASVEEYKNNIQYCREEIIKIAQGQGILNLSLSINTRDDFDLMELYLTATGSSIESGDEGLVGRGNRITGTIAPFQLMSMEGACGKNPVYHVGKVYYVAAQKLAEKINSIFNIPCEVTLVSQSGRDLTDPWIVAVNVPDEFRLDSQLRSIVEGEMSLIPNITDLVINGKVKLY